MTRIVEDYLDRPEWIEANGKRDRVYEVPDDLWNRYVTAKESLYAIETEIDVFKRQIVFGRLIPAVVSTVHVPLHAHMMTEIDRRCLVTGNLVGTDTWGDKPCSCANCRYRKERGERLAALGYKLTG